MRHERRSFLILWAAVLCGAIAPPTAAARETITLSVDASEAPRKLLHARLTIPAFPGPLTLVYPKWIPGEHGPTGPLTDVAGLRIRAAGEPLVWRRDPVDMHAISFMVPKGARSVDVEFDFLSAGSAEGYSSAASATEQLIVLSWNQVVLYPAEDPPGTLTYRASLDLPPGWKFGTALPVASQEGRRIHFQPVSLVTLIDSPLLAGANFRTLELTPGRTPAHFIDMAADSRAALEIKPPEIAKYRQLITEALALFGAHHYREYHFLLTLSDHVAHFGLEHHESSDDRVEERTWLDDDLLIDNSNLMPHELVHSWNGKYRRPAGLATPDYQQPMKGDLLWIYEGLTQYLGFVLGARSGVRTLEQSRQNLALQAAYLDIRPGRNWRPLIDTAVEAQLLYESTPQWQSWRRGTDFYNEGLLIWLEADALIRQKAQGRRSLDDFCRLFHGGKSGPPEMVPYTLDEVVATLNQVAPYDWKGFFAARVDSITPRAPLGGIEKGGWKLAYTDSLPAFLKAIENANEYVDLMFSLGFRVSKKDATIIDVILSKPAGKAGIGPGMKLLAVNGRKWTKDVLRDAVNMSRKSSEPIELVVDNGDFIRTFKLDYHDGPRYPRLERVAGKADLLDAILKPLRPRTR